MKNKISYIIIGIILTFVGVLSIIPTAFYFDNLRPVPSQYHIEVDEDNLELFPGQKYTLNPFLILDNEKVNAYSDKFTYSTNRKDLIHFIDVNSGGTFQVDENQKNGEAIITIENGGKTKDVTVKVKEGLYEIYNVEISNDNLHTIYLGTTYKLNFYTNHSLIDYDWINVKCIKGNGSNEEIDGLVKININDSSIEIEPIGFGEGCLEISVKNTDISPFTSFYLDFKCQFKSEDINSSLKNETYLSNEKLKEIKDLSVKVTTDYFDLSGLDIFENLDRIEIQNNNVVGFINFNPIKTKFDIIVLNDDLYQQYMELSTINEDLKLHIYPKYEKRIFIGYPICVEKNFDYKIVKDEEVDELFQNGISIEGYSFNGWYSKCENDYFSAKDKIATNNNVIRMKAYGEYIAKKYNVFFYYIDDNGNEVQWREKREIIYGEKLSFPVSPTTSNKRPFKQWIEKGTGTIYKDGDIYKQARDLYLIADTSEGYIVNLDANGGSVTPSYITVLYNSPYGNIPTPTRKNATFLGWYLNGTKIESTTKYLENNSSGVTLIAKWSGNFANYNEYKNDGNADLLVDSNVNLESDNSNANFVIKQTTNKIHIKNATLSSLSMETRNSPLNITLENVTVQQKQDAINPVVDFSKYINQTLTINLIGNNKFIGVNNNKNRDENMGIGLLGNDIKFTGNGSLTIQGASGNQGYDGQHGAKVTKLSIDTIGQVLIQGGNGGNGISATQVGASGSTGKNGGYGLVCNNLSISDNAILKLVGGNGGIGGNGANGSTGSAGGNGGTGGNGGYALYGEKSSKISMNNNLILFGGNGANGGNAGNGGNGANGAYGYFGGQNGGSGGNGGNGGNAGSPLGLYNGFTIDSEKLLEINTPTQGNGGNAGNGGNGGNGGSAGWLMPHGNGGSPGKAGSPGIGIIDGKSGRDGSWGAKG